MERIRPAFEEDGRLHRLYPLYEALDTFLYATGDVTRVSPHVRDSVDLKRIMITVVVSLMPCVFMAIWNTGYQANSAMQVMGFDSPPGWRGEMMAGIGCDPSSFWSNFLHGALYFLPVYIVCMLAGGAWEVVFAVTRRHEISEGFLVTGLLFPLTLPPQVPLWQVAVGISFGVVIAKELFGGTGRNFLNPALSARAYLFFAHPTEMTGDSVWTAVDGFTSATPLTAMGSADVATGMQAIHVSWSDAFLGRCPGSMGETSVVACLIGVAVLVVTGVASWRIMLSMLIGGMACASVFWAVGSDSNAMFQLAPHWHLVIGSFAFGLVFMATDPVSAAQTETGRWIYGFLIGTLCILVRVVNPAYPEGVMLAILLGNVFAPLIDYFVVAANIRRRVARNAS
jgi:Na+-transporting NADH:ubiquinone oxidoreductase subunit B